MVDMVELVKQFVKRNMFRLRRLAAFIWHVMSSVLQGRKPVIKQRYVRTRQGRLRARYIFSSIMIACLATTSLAYSGVDTGAALVKASNAGAMQAHLDSETSGLLAGIEPAGFSTRGRGSDAGDIVAFNDLRAGVTPPMPEKAQPREWQAVVQMEKGGTLSGLLEKHSVGAGDAYLAIKAMSEALDPRDLRPGQRIVIHYNRATDGSTAFKGMDVIKSGIETVQIRRAPEFGFDAQIEKKELVNETRAARAKVTRSIYADLAAQDVPDGIINQFIKAYSWSIDFQRDIWGGEEIEVLYTVNRTEDESYLRSDELLYANLIIKGKARPIYLFTKKDGDRDYFNPKGESVRKALLKTPVDGARISSSYGMRKHPVLGYSKMHKGLDFAAPTGTPIYAAGKGVVERANRFGSYGNYIRIRHNGTYKTAYAHLHKIARGIRAGARVKQGQVIGYVGSTGRSTGPHLHYEVIVNGKQVNPQSVDLPIGETLSGTNMANFKIARDKLDQKFQKHLQDPSLIKVSQP